MTPAQAIMQASEDPGITFGAGALASAAVGLFVFLVKRAITSGDSQRKNLTDLIKDHSKLEMRVDAAWREIDEVKTDLREIRSTVYGVKK